MVVDCFVEHGCHYHIDGHKSLFNTEMILVCSLICHLIEHAGVVI